MSFGELQTQEELAGFNKHLENNSFVDPSSKEVGQKDIDMFQRLTSRSVALFKQYPNVSRWSKTIIQQTQVRDFSCGDMSNCNIAKIDDKPKDVHNRPEKGDKKTVKIDQKPKQAHPGKPIGREAYIDKRLERWDELRASHNKWLDEQKAGSVPIKVTLPDGKQLDGNSWITSPMDIAKGLSNSLAKACIISKVDGVLWDMTRPLESDCNIELLKFDNAEAKDTFWHSSAHVIGEAMEQYFGGSLVFGPPLAEGGFFYDIDSQYQISEKDFPSVEKVVSEIVKENQPFERLFVSKEDLYYMFNYNPYKMKFINEKVTTERTSVYRCGTLIDLCRGPHIENTGKVKAFKCTKTSTAYNEGKADKEIFSRLYGISFPDKKQMKEWEKFQEQARERDHRKIGKEQELFMFNEYSPGSCFWYPKGAYIYNALMDLMKEEYRKRGFKEVMSPNMYDSDLWKKSGHWQHYSDDMFTFDVEKKKWALKPMNCPGHATMFGHRARSFKELPLRFADFGVLHRNELAGALSGLTRVRRFQQDDAHIFCTHEQIEDEIKQAIDFLTFIIHDTFGMKYKLYLSTRPEGYIGELEVWDKAEAQLKSALNTAGCDFEVDEGGGAFYGPKIDIKVTDALNRSHQTATVQLDFNLPSEGRFNLTYVDNDNKSQHPVMIHRAILGSVERQVAILCENFGGNWPFWLSPRQVKVITVGEKFNAYGKEVADALYAAGIEAEMEADSGLTLNKKIRNAQMARYNFQIVLGEKEMTERTINIRTRCGKQHGVHGLDWTIERLSLLRKTRNLNAEEVFAEGSPTVQEVKAPYVKKVAEKKESPKNKQAPKQPAPKEPTTAPVSAQVSGDMSPAMQLYTRCKTAGDNVRKLKSEKAGKDAVMEAVGELKASKAEYKETVGSDYSDNKPPQ